MVSIRPVSFGLSAAVNSASICWKKHDTEQKELYTSITEMMKKNMYNIKKNM